MALLNFPTDPNPGDTWTIGAKTYQWSGTAWLVLSSSLSATTSSVTTLLVTSTENINTASIGTTEALVVRGGASFARDIYVGGLIYANGSLLLTTASFNNTPSDGTDIQIIDLGGGILEFNNVSTLHSVTSRGNSTTNVVKFLNATESTSTNSGALLITGGLGVGKRINSESIQIADTVFDSTKTTVNNTIQYTIDSYLLSQYRSAKYFVQIDEGTTSTARFHSTEIMLTASNTGSAFAVIYGTIATNGELGVFSKDVTSVMGSTYVNLYFTPVDTIEKTVKVLRTAMTA